MTEKVGNVVLNLDDYPGEDLYSDGKVEDELLAIAKTYAPEDFDRAVAERKSWPVMYHFSTIRRNILSWYPGLEGKKVLEIGSGCGAVTAELASRAAAVTCVELSKKRSLINANRNRSFRNISIEVGNFEDVEKRLPSDFDVITLIGVFEYAVNYIHSARPYEDFLAKIRSHLKADGVVLLAIENRLGLKYFAGCTEDHTGGFFDGIEGYRNTDYVRTFSRGELDAICRRSGFPALRFYYPYPDYKFPMAVYSDEYLPKKGELTRNIVNFDRKRLVLFDEAGAFDSFAGNGLFPEFSNSFFLELRNGAVRDDADAERTLYSKFSNERSERLAIRTDIASRNGERIVRKLPATLKAVRHIGKMKDALRELTELYAKTRFVPNRLSMEGVSAIFEYLDGRTLEEVLDERAAGKASVYESGLKGILSEIDRTEDCRFKACEAFREVFGDAPSLAGLPASHAANIDLLPGNIMVTEEAERAGGGAAGLPAWHVIDYEWTFFFPVPLKYIKWRTLHYFIEGSTKRFFLRDRDLYEKAGISPEETGVFESMEKHFQAYIQGERTPLRELYGAVSEGAVDLPAILKRMAGRTDGTEKVKLYLDSGAGFREEETVALDMPLDGKLELQQPLAGLKALRIDPAECAGCVTVHEIGTELGPIDPASIESPGTRLDLRRWLFDSADPFLVVRGWPADARYLYAVLSFKGMDADSAEFLRKELDSRDRRILALTQADRKKEDLLLWRGEVIRQLMKSTPMKAYRRLRVAAKRKDPYPMLRPLLPSDAGGILYCIDHCALRKEDFFLRGWCFDREFLKERVHVVNSNDVEIPAVISRYRRPDVAKTYALPEERELGFSVSIPYALVKDPPLYLEVENARGYTCEKLEIELDEAKREAANAALREKEGKAHGISGYDDWAREHRADARELDRQRAEADDPSLCFSVVVPLYRTDGALLEALTDSVLSQTYGNFELILSDGSGEDSPLTPLLTSLAGRDARIRVLSHGRRLGISDNTNLAIAAAKGSWIVFADHDDLLAPDALYELAARIHAEGEAELIYTDEDKYLPGGEFGEPNFKPDFSPDFLTSVNYICHLVAAKRELITRVGPLDPAFDGAQDYDFILRCTEATERISHIPKVLYHWRWTENSTAADPEAKAYAYAAGVRAVKAHLERLGIEASVTRGVHAGTCEVRETVSGEPLISVIIANKDHSADLTRALQSIWQGSTYRQLEYIIVENNSAEEETFRTYEKLKAMCPSLAVVRYEGAFNYSAINNLGAAEAKGDYLLFLNNDTELIAPDSIERMLGVCQREDVGAVGARLYFEDGSIQHAGVVLGYGGIAGHAFREFGPKESGYENRIVLRQDVSAVTAACMLVKRSVFAEAGGFYEGLAVAFNDVDLCMKIRALGKYIVYEPGAEFYHYESKSRGYEDTPERQARFTSEVRVFKERWKEALLKGDPFYNPNLTLDRPDFSLRK